MRCRYLPEKIALHWNRLVPLSSFEGLTDLQRWAFLFLRSIYRSAGRMHSKIFLRQCARRWLVRRALFLLSALSCDPRNASESHGPGAFFWIFRSVLSAMPAIPTAIDSHPPQGLREYLQATRMWLREGQGTQAREPAATGNWPPHLRADRSRRKRTDRNRGAPSQN